MSKGLEVAMTEVAKVEGQSARRAAESAGEVFARQGKVNTGCH